MKSMKLWSKRFGYNRQYDPTVNPSIQVITFYILHNLVVHNPI